MTSTTRQQSIQIVLHKGTASKKHADENGQNFDSSQTSLPLNELTTKHVHEFKKGWYLPITSKFLYLQLKHSRKLLIHLHQPLIHLQPPFQHQQMMITRVSVQPMTIILLKYFTNQAYVPAYFNNVNKCAKIETFQSSDRLEIYSRKLKTFQLKYKINAERFRSFT